MSTKINVRSPFFLHYNDSSLGQVDLNIYVGTGTAASAPLVYNLFKDDVNDADTYIAFEISELVRDYITTNFNGTYDSEPVWVKTTAYLETSAGAPIATENDTYLAFDGYSYLWEGKSPQLSRTKLFSNSTVWRPPSTATKLPFFSEDITKIEFFNNGTELTGDEITVTDGTDTSDKIVYADVPSAALTHILITKSDLTTETVYVRTMDCSRFTPIKVTFYNRYGALQDLYFFNKSIKSLSTSKDTYKSNLVTINASDVSISTTRHQYQTIDMQGRESITLNTGFVSEDYNEPIKELLLSENVWATIDGNVLPVNVRNSEMTFRTSLNDKMVDYSIDLEYSFDAIQNIR